MLGSFGIFWLSGDDEHAVGGRLEIVGGHPRLGVSGSIRRESGSEPLYSPLSYSGRTLAFPHADEELDLVVHGYMAENSSAITLLGTSITGSERSDVGVETEFLKGQYLIRGEHIRPAEDLFIAARMRINGMDEWHSRADISVSISPTLGWIENDPPPPKLSEFDLPDSAGSLFLIETDTELDNSRAQSWPEVTLQWGSSRCMSLEEVFDSFVRPVKSFFTTLLNEEAAILRVELLNARSGIWLDVSCAEIRPDAVTDASPLLSRDAAGLEVVANWLTTFPQMSPVPYVLAGVISSEGFLDAEVLALCTATEGLHRRLYPESRKISKADMETTKRALKDRDLVLPAASREALISATQYLWEPGFPMRLAELASRLTQVCPQVFGDVTRWKKEVAIARNSNAHLLHHSQPEDAWMASYVVGQSLRWFLRALLLQNAGTKDEGIAIAYQRSPEFEKFVRSCVQIFPVGYSNYILPWVLRAVPGELPPPDLIEHFSAQLAHAPSMPS